MVYGGRGVVGEFSLVVAMIIRGTGSYDVRSTVKPVPQEPAIGGT